MELEELQKDFESRIDELSRRISEFENIKAENIELRSNFLDINAKLKTLQEKSSAVSNSIENSKNLQERYNFVNDEKIQSVLQNIDFLKNKLEKHAQSINDYNANFINLKNDITNLENIFYSLKKYIADFKNETEKRDFEVTKKIDNLNKDFLLNKSAFEDLTNKIDICKNQHEIFNNQYNKLNSEIKHNQDIIFQHKNDCEKQIVHSKESCTNIINQILEKINSINVPDISNLVKIDKIIDLEREFNLCSLDSKNVALKCNNIESQLQIITRKLENLQIVLKGLELNGNR